MEALFYFIDVLLKIPDDLQEKLMGEMIDHAGKEGFIQMDATNRDMYSPTLDGMIERLAKERIEKGIKQGKEKGREEGRREGMEEAKIVLAKNLIKENFSNEKIAKLISWEPDKIQAIRESEDH
ncbi:hypothetical protein [Virgibacillus kimchii]